MAAKGDAEEPERDADSGFGGVGAALEEAEAEVVSLAERAVWQCRRVLYGLDTAAEDLGWQTRVRAPATRAASRARGQQRARRRATPKRKSQTRTRISLTNTPRRTADAHRPRRRHLRPGRAHADGGGQPL
jgi:hypothetical protein